MAIKSESIVTKINALELGSAQRSGIMRLFEDVIKIASAGKETLQHSSMSLSVQDIAPGQVWKFTSPTNGISQEPFRIIHDQGGRYVALKVSKDKKTNNTLLGWTSRDATGIIDLFRIYAAEKVADE